MKVFRDVPSSHEQLFLLPRCVGEFVGENAPVRVFAEVMESLDTSALYASYRGGGAPAYDPLMLAKVLLFGLSIGLRSSRRLAQALQHDTRFIWLSGMSRPDFRTLCRFRRQQEATLRELFVGTVGYCQREGLVLLEEVAVDGTKLEANVSGKETHTVERLEQTQAQLDARIGRLLRDVEEADRAEDAQWGEASGDEVPKALEGIARRKERLARAREQAEQTGEKSVGATDLESRVMKTRSGNRPAYNAQAAVDGHKQVIVGAEVSQASTDEGHLEPMLQQVQHNTGQLPGKVMADNGYGGATALQYASESKMDIYIAVTSQRPRSDACDYDAQTDCYTDAQGRHYPFQRERYNRHVAYRVYYCKQTRGELWIRQDEQRLQRMRQKLATAEGRAIYRRRQQIVEPVFGQIKGVPNLRRLLLRGLSGARIEFLMACVAHNIGKAVRARLAQRLAVTG